jgi:hypothetical protein
MGTSEQSFCLEMTVVMVFTVLVRARQSICDQAVTSMGFFLTFLHTNAQMYLKLGLYVISAHLRSLQYAVCVTDVLISFTLKTKLRGLSSRANYTDRAAAAGRRS